MAVQEEYATSKLVCWPKQPFCWAKQPLCCFFMEQQEIYSNIVW
jgi:hypothetical protein